MVMKLVVLAVVGLGALPGAAAAASTWSAPQTIDDHSFPVPAVAIARDGSGVIAWRRAGGDGRGQPAVRLALAAPRGRFQRTDSLPLARPPFPIAVALDRRGRAITAWGTTAAAVPGRSVLQTVTASRRGRFGRVTDFTPPTRELGGLSLLSSRSGDTLATWQERRAIRAALSRDGAPFGPPTSLSGTDAYQSAVALDDRGNAVAVWGATGGVILSAFRPAGGTFGSPQRVSLPGRFAREPAVAFDAAGNAVAVWAQSDGATYRVQAATRRAGALGFDAPRAITGPDEAAREPRVAAGADGEATVVYVATRPRLRFTAARGVIRAAFRPPGATAFRRPVSVSAPTDRARAPVIGADRNGGVVLAWTTRSPGISRLFAATGHDGSYGHPRRVSARGENVGGEDASLAVNERGAAILVWSRGHRIRAARLTG